MYAVYDKYSLFKKNAFVIIVSIGIDEFLENEVNHLHIEPSAAFQCAT